MDITVVNPALREATEKAPKVRVESRFVLALVASLSRLAPGNRVEGVERRAERYDGVRLRVYVPDVRSGAALLWVHGGGLVLGSAAIDDVMCGETARLTGAVVVSVDYRLAPKHRFPAAIDDCRTGFAWLASNADALGVDLSRVAVGGQSAGGGLAACLVQRLHDEGVAVAAQWLFCPMLDDRTAVERAHDEKDHFVWNNRSNLVGWSSYLGDQLGADDLPAYAAASRRESFEGLPPTWIYSSDIELFYAEDVEYARRLEAAGVDVTFETVAGAPHGFEAWAPDNEVAVSLVAGARAWLQERLSV